MNINQAGKLVLLAIFIISWHFTHLFKWASSGQCFFTIYNMQHTNNKKQWAVWHTKTKKPQNWPSRYRNGWQHATEKSYKCKM